MNDPAPAVASLDFSSKEVTVPASSSTTITLYPGLPLGLEPSRLPVYSGYIAINGSDGSSLSLPYLGVAGSMLGATVLDVENTSISTSKSAPGYAPIAANTTFTLPANNATATNATVYPAVVLSLALGTAYLRVDVVPYHPTSPSYGGYSKSNTTEFLGLQTLGKHTYPTPTKTPLPLTRESSLSILPINLPQATSSASPRHTSPAAQR